MHKIYQTTFGDGSGNCFAACIASLLELDIEEVPNFCEGNKNDWWEKTNKWLAKYNLWFCDVKILEYEDGNPLPWPGYYIVSGKGPRGLQHSVIYKDGNLLHDPYPDGGGVKPEWVGVLVPLIPPSIGRKHDDA